MGKAFLVATRLWAPLSALLGQGALTQARRALAPASSAPTEARPATLGRALTPPAHESPADAALSGPLALPIASRPRPLKVVRVRDLCGGTQHAGRLVISGRMADVCAELERLASAHPGLLH